MKMPRKSRRIFEPPAVLLTDLAFNLVIFFVVCASTEAENGRKQPIPRGTKDPTTAQTQNVEVVLTRTTVAVNGVMVPLEDLSARLHPMLAQKTRTEERMVVLKSSKDTPYSQWIRTTAFIEQAGGIVALQMEEAREVVVP